MNFLLVMLMRTAMTCDEYNYEDIKVEIKDATLYRLDNEGKVPVATKSFRIKKEAYLLGISLECVPMDVLTEYFTFYELKEKGTNSLYRREYGRRLGFIDKQNLNVTSRNIRQTT